MHVIYFSYYIAAFSVKLALFLLYLRLFKVDRTTRWLIYTGVLCCSAAYAACILTYTIECAASSRTVGAGSCRTPPRPLLLFNGIFGLVSDIYLLVLPIPIVWRIQMPLRKRLGVLAIFGTGIL